MTSGRGTFLRVGLLVVIGIAVAVGLAIFLGGSRIHNGRIFESYFEESVQGLELGAPVKFRGVTLGRVTEIGLASTQYFLDRTVDIRRATYRLVYVRYLIDLGRFGRSENFDAAISAGLRAHLASQGITGLSYLELDFVDPQKYPLVPVPWTPKYDLIPSVPSTLAQVQDAAQALLARINAIDIVGLGRSAQSVLDDLHTQLSTGDAHQALAGAAALMATTREAVQRADLPGLASELRSTAADLRGVVDGPQGREIVAATARAADKLAETAAKLPALVAAADATVHQTSNGVADLQAELEPVLRDARAAAANLREATDRLRRYPAGVLLGAPPPREGER
jgi:ABC-type transporter Mla subunit MlaD